MPPQQHQPSPYLVVPHESEGPRSQPTEPNPTGSALHEAHLRSPVSVPLQIGKETPSCTSSLIAVWARRGWLLAKFPASVETIYTDTIQQCRHRGAPPLSQDLVMDLGLGSQALQAVAFRAVAPMAYPQPDDAGFLDLLEQLH